MITYRSLSPGVRFCHWIWAACIAVLFVTGLYIGNPMFIGTQGNEPAKAVTQLLSMETIRYVHFAAAFLLIACMVARVYLLFTYAGNRQFPNFFSLEHWRGLFEILAYYSFLKSRHRTYLRSPLAATAYFAFFIMVAIEIITGLAMYLMVRPETWFAQLLVPVNGWLGNEYVTHLLHHVVAWIIILFAVVHIYLVIYSDVMEKNGEISSIVTGQKHFKERPVNINDSIIEVQNK